MKNKMKMLFLLAIALLVVTACSKTPKTESPEQEPSNDGPEKVEGEQYIAPFTGMQSEEEQTLRPVLATINNHPLARPQSGISDADIVYEVLTEGDTTRLLALFQSELPEEIGPIRSARDTFIHIAKGLDAFYVAHGYSPDALALLKSGEVDHVNGMQHDGTLFERSSDRKAPHNSYTSGESIKTAAENISASMVIDKMPSLSFHESIESAKIGDGASTVVVQNGSHPNFTSTYAYDEENGTYSRTVNDELTVDHANDEQVELSNILVFEAEHQTIDDEGRQAIDIESGGKGLLFHAGVVKEIEWENKNGMLLPVENGVPVELVSGKTWIHIVRTNPGIDANVTSTP